jgi:methylated-DNA-[protein]-cysteine S-methyltransferase
MARGRATFPTAIGHCAVAWTEVGICATWLPEGQRRTAARERGELPPEIAAAIVRIQALFDGERDDLRDLDLDLAGVPSFNRQVYDVIRGVGPGETTTYGEIARALGTPYASQQVGQALAHNPIPIIIPCHRVLAAGGKVGGFSAPGGVQTKLRILQIEGAAPDGQPALF